MAERDAQMLSGRGRLIEVITSPIGFFVLALLIVEAFLATVLVGGSLAPQDKMTCVWLGVGMFVLVVAIVSLLVWFKSKAFVFDRQAHLDEYRMEQERLRRMSGGAVLEDLAPLLEETIRRELSSEHVAARVAQATKADVVTVLKEQAERISQGIEQSSFISVDLSAFGKGVQRYPVAALKSMDVLTDEVYFALEKLVRPYAYGTDWVLREKGTGRVFRTVRMLTNTPLGKPLPDVRSLEEVGIKAGMELEAVRPSPVKEAA